MGVGPEGQRVALLLVYTPEKNAQGHHDKDRTDLQPVLTRHRLGCFPLFCLPFLHYKVGGKVPLARKINEQPDHHAHTRSTKAPVKADLLSEGPADKGRKERPEIDAHIEYAEGTVAAIITRRIKRPDLCRDIRLEGAVSEDQKDKRGEEQAVGGHQEMSDGHEHRSDNHRPPLTEEAVSQNPAQKRSEVDEAGIEPVNLGRPFLRKLQVPDHVVDQQRPHPVIGKPLPHFSKEEDIESCGMSCASRSLSA